MRAIQVERTGGPEVLEAVDLPDPAPGEGEVVLRISAAGVNFIDTYQRSGAYQRSLPFVPGLEGAGRVVALGQGVDSLDEGERVAFCDVPGAYASHIVAPADRLVPVPDDLDDDTAASIMLQGATAHYLASSTFRLAHGSTALILAAAGGVGRLLVQLAKQYGAHVIAATSTDDKADLPASAGADHVVRYRQVDLVKAVGDLTDGEGVDVVYDSVGADTFSQSLDCLRPRGTLVLYGQSSGRVQPVDPQTLAAKGSLYLTRPVLAHYIVDHGELSWRIGELFESIVDERLEPRIDRTWPLDEAAEAHRYIEAGKTTGKLLLKP